MKETLESSNSTAGAVPATSEKCKLSMSVISSNTKLANVGHVLRDGEARSDDVSIQEDVHFSDMYLNDDVLAGLLSTGFIRPSPVQLQAIPTGRCGLDLIVQAKSGTGKTCVFTVLALEMVAASATTTQVLVIAPTREIAVQIAGVMTSVGRHIKGLKVGVFIGGTAVENPGVCHIAVGTPGRLHHMLTDAKLCGRNIRLLVLDEADQMLDSFRNEVQQIVASLPHSKQVVCASATYTPPLQELAKKLMRSPVHVTLGSKQLLAVTQYIHKLPYTGTSNQAFRSKLLHLKGILGSATFNQCLIFTNSIMKAESVCDSLRSDGWPVACLCGGQNQKQRLQALDDLVTHRCRVLVATDLAARGLDSPHVSLVVSLEAPPHPHTYLHRVGRAGRFGAQGVSVVLAQQGDDWLYVQAIATMLDLNVTVLPEPSLQQLHQWQETLPHLTKDQLQQWASSSDRKLEAWKMDAVRPQVVENGIRIVDAAVQSNGVNGNVQGLPLNNTETIAVRDPSHDEAVSDSALHDLINMEEVIDAPFVSPKAAVLTEINPDLKVYDFSKKDEIIELLKVSIGSSKMIVFSRQEYLKQLLTLGEGSDETTSGGVANHSPALRDLSLSEQRLVLNCLDATDAVRRARTAAADAAWSSVARDASAQLKARARGEATAVPLTRKSAEEEVRDKPISEEGRVEAEDGGRAVMDDFSFHIKVMNEEKKLHKEQTKKFAQSKLISDNDKENSVKTKTKVEKTSQKNSNTAENLFEAEEYHYDDNNYDEFGELYEGEDSVEREEYGDPLSHRSYRPKTREVPQHYTEYQALYAGHHEQYRDQYLCSAAPYGAYDWGHSNSLSSEYYGYNHYYDGQSTSRSRKKDRKRRSPSEIPYEEESLTDANYDYCLPGYPGQTEQQGNQWDSFQPVVLLDRSKEPKTEKDKTASAVRAKTKKHEKLAYDDAENVMPPNQEFHGKDGKSEPSNTKIRGARNKEDKQASARYDGHSTDVTVNKSDGTQTKRKCEHPGCSSSVSSSCCSEESDDQVEENYYYFDGYNRGKYCRNNDDGRPSYRDYSRTSHNKPKSNTMKGHCHGCSCGGQYPGSLGYLSTLHQFAMMDSFVRAMGRASAIVAQQMRRDLALWQGHWGPPATDQRRRRPQAEGDACDATRHRQPSHPASARQRRGAHKSSTSADSSRDSDVVREHHPRTTCAGSFTKPRCKDVDNVTAVTTNQSADVSASASNSMPAASVIASNGNSKPAAASAADHSHSKHAVSLSERASGAHSKPAVAVIASEGHSKPAAVQSRKKARKNKK